MPWAAPARRPASPAAFHVAPRTSAAGRASAASPIASTAAAATASAKPTSVTSQRTAGHVLFPAPIQESRNPRGADGEPDRAEAPGPAGTVGDDHADVGLEMRIDALLDAPRAEIGILRQQQHTPAVIPGLEIGLIDAGVGQHKAVRAWRLSARSARREAPLRPARGWLDQMRVFPRHRRQLAGPGTGLDCRRSR